MIRPQKTSSPKQPTVSREKFRPNEKPTEPIPKPTHKMIIVEFGF